MPDPSSSALKPGRPTSLQPSSLHFPKQSSYFEMTLLLVPQSSPDSSFLPMPDLKCETEVNESNHGFSHQPTFACPWFHRPNYLTNCPQGWTQPLRLGKQTRAYLSSSDLTCETPKHKTVSHLNSSNLPARLTVHTCARPRLHKFSRWLQLYIPLSDASSSEFCQGTLDYPRGYHYSCLDVMWPQSWIFFFYPHFSDSVFPAPAGKIPGCSSNAGTQLTQLYPHVPNLVPQITLKKLTTLR